MGFDYTFRRALSTSIVVTVIAVSVGSAFAQDQPKFELLHLWAEDIEAHALSSFSEPMRAAGVEWSEQVVETNFEGIRETFSKRLAHNVPPTASFWIGGGSAAEELIEQNVFKVIVPTRDEQPFTERLLPEILEAVKHGDGISVLPIGIHLQNFMVYNRRVLDEIGEPLPESWDDFVRAAAKARRAGYTGLSVSDQPWQLRFLLSAIMVEYLSPEEMQALASEVKIGGAQREAIRAAFRILARLEPYLNADFRDLNWKLAVDQVVQGRSMANTLGDFIAPLTFGVDTLRCALPPGNRYVTWSFDAIILTNTNDPNEILGQEQFIRTVFDSDHAARYISRKGGLPVISDFNTTPLSQCSAVSVAAWGQSETRVRLMTNEWTRSMAVISNFGQYYLNHPDTDVNKLTSELIETLEALRNNEAND